MKQNKVIKLSIGNELYNYQPFNGIFTYKVIGVREYENSVLYEIECMECRDHENCKLIVAQTDNLPQFQYVQMINDDEEHEQYYWHNNLPYFITKNDCKKHAYKKAVDSKKAEIEKTEKLLKSQKERLAEIQALIDGIVPKI